MGSNWQEPTFEEYQEYLHKPFKRRPQQVEDWFIKTANDLTGGYQFLPFLFYKRWQRLLLVSIFTTAIAIPLACAEPAHIWVAFIMWPPFLYAMARVHYQLRRGISSGLMKRLSRRHTKPALADLWIHHHGQYNKNFLGWWEKLRPNLYNVAKGMGHLTLPIPEKKEHVIIKFLKDNW